MTDRGIRMDIKVDRGKGVVVVKRGGVVVKNLRFDGKLIAGAGSSFLGNVEVKEAYFGKGCLINGVIKAERVVVGAKTRFSKIICKTALILNGCVGKEIIAEGDVRIGNSKIDVVEAKGTVVVDGSAKLGKLAAGKVIAAKAAKTADLTDSGKEAEDAEKTREDEKAGSAETEKPDKSNAKESDKAG